MRLAAITKSNIVFAFIFGMVIASGIVIWRNFISPYLVPPGKPNFSKQGEALYKNHPQFLPVTKFSPLPTKRIVSDPTEIKYRGKVNVSRGLVLRTEPRQGASRSSGVEYKANVAVLKETPDREWVYIRVENTKETGWVRSGNIFKE